MYVEKTITGISLKCAGEKRNYYHAQRMIKYL